MTEVIIASPDTLLGRLQRGRGQGYLDALLAERHVAASALLACITADPRVDQQVESRDEYYGRLANAIDLELVEVDAFLFSENDKERGEGDMWLVLGSLGWMARLGRADASALLRRYIEVGRRWEDAIGAITYPTQVPLERLDELVSARCPSIDDLTRFVRFTDPALWAQWDKTNERFHQASVRHDAEVQGDRRRRVELSQLSTAELLKRREVTLLRGRSGESDKAFLLDAARSEDDQMRRDAIKVLGWQRDARVFDAAEAELRRVPEGDWPPNAGAIAIHSLMRDGPVSRVRAWLNDVGRTRELAMAMIATWPWPEDAPLLRSMAERFMDEDELYLACDAVDGLATLEDAAAVPLIEMVYRETTYSYLRKRCARALALISENFAESLAVESLWDCETETCAIGCATASLSKKVVRKRLAELSEDHLAGRRVRALAARRSDAVHERPAKHLHGSAS